MNILMQSILACRFEQTDVGNDEAVEMAIADIIALIISLDHSREMSAKIVMEGFNTVFVTRNTFVHSPALCYHFEEVLGVFCTEVFGGIDFVARNNRDFNETQENEIKESNEGINLGLAGDKALQGVKSCEFILDFLVSQLLHTPMDVEGVIASALHDATRILCLKLIRASLRMAWELSTLSDGKSAAISKPKIDYVPQQYKDPILNIIKDDLCLSLLMVGQGIWAYQDPSSDAIPGMISMSVLSEICSTLSTMWSLGTNSSANSRCLREVLVVQFEAFFTGFYQRALSLLRRLPVPTDTLEYNANQIFDAEVEIILESLVDILHLHCYGSDENVVGSLETMFVTYDCNVIRSDVAAGLVTELSRCCGGYLDASGILLEVEQLAGFSRENSGTGSTSEPMKPLLATPRMAPSKSFLSSSSQSKEGDAAMRHVPAHLRELCAEALMSIMESLFVVSNASDSLDDAEGKSANSESVAAANENLSNFRTLEVAKQKKCLLREACQIFNQKSSRAFDFLLNHGILKDSVTPVEIATFLRNGIVLGLNKASIGEYLGTKGKSPVAGKSPPDWERDWFHIETLMHFCKSFHFRDQSLLDCLRMFLASFRLPGEAQQIDRILQAFAESCQCEESQNGIFSPDVKKASDAAYLLSFSIIMLNTDLHNDNIRADRKMKKEDFVKNNTDYGSDITDPGFAFPPEYLIGIYESIQYEQIRTVGEGADGVMTFERWKDVMRNESGRSPAAASSSNEMKRLVSENMWVLILSAVQGFWSVPSEQYAVRYVNNRSGMLGSQGSRLGVDLSVALLNGAKKIARLDIFQDLFTRLCFCTGLVGEYSYDAVERTSAFVESVERQSALVVVIKTAIDNGDLIGFEGWKCVWSIMFELRDLKLLSRALLVERDPDLLRPDTRRDWEMRLVKECYEATGSSNCHNANDKRRGGFLGSLIFGSPITSSPQRNKSESSKSPSQRDGPLLALSDHGKEELVLWNDYAPSDEEEETELEENGFGDNEAHDRSLGLEFEKLLVKESQSSIHQGPVTGLETFEDTRVYQVSPRARVRRRLAQLCDFSLVLSETRFLDLESLNVLLRALVKIIAGTSVQDERRLIPVPLSPGSEAVAEVWLCEITLKNRDRLGKLWKTILKEHYHTRLACTTEETASDPIVVKIPGKEKCLTSLLRICHHSVHRKDVNNEILKGLDVLCTDRCEVTLSSASNLNFYKHLSEGLWRICRDVDGLRLIDKEGWDGLLSLIQYCASKGDKLITRDGEKAGTLLDDDPALQVFRCLHLMLRSNELRDAVPFRIVSCIRTLVLGGELNNCPKLSIAGLDLLSLLHARLQTVISQSLEKNERKDILCWAKYWLSIMEGMAEASNSRYPSTRQHSIAMFTDSLVDRHGQDIPINELCLIISNVCVPMAGDRLHELIENRRNFQFDHEEVMIELELCISAIFKPFLHYLKRLTSSPDDFIKTWISILDVLARLLCQEYSTADNSDNHPLKSFLNTTKQHLTEHLRNAIMILISKGIIVFDSTQRSCIQGAGEDISIITWNAIENISYVKPYINEWKQSGENIER
eukprot:CAMPEP_0194126666 /NCGR_PEP_ID=MMETSP0150-20130528/60105_1 /TAXON_ID=122233 /ORGANISM="Chaetoceros debilis, Strain MM31A-1" /LENGTH=1558 /DNA_ID=CAMNT_0038820539 /DNA_START=463 /DNA_END=5139 /DNA_ORIENTATION=-